MAEDRTYEGILARCLAEAPADVDTREESIFRDAVTPTARRHAEFYAVLESAFDLVFLTTAPDEYLDRGGKEHNITRRPATVAVYKYDWNGDAAPPIGSRFFANNIFFALRQSSLGELHLEAEVPGIGGNNIVPGTLAVPVENISGLAASAVGVLVTPGTDAENDDSYRARIFEKIAGPSQNGTRQHYKTWCEEVPGVGRARIIPLFGGANTVAGIIIGADGLPAVKSVLDSVQEKIDPMTLGITIDFGGVKVPVGDGLGDGTANIGAHFAAIPPSALTINVKFNAELEAGIATEEIKTSAGIAFKEHLKDLALKTPENQAIIVRMSAISAILYTLPGLLDYNGLTLNGEASNIELSGMQVAVLGEVVVNAVI
ncbi:MAG: baseplate J/gp47 family protein [Oscillospiraceae bacterium]|jgi:uncharacterized phage protein gp47/JayE|nr:baseplate J/gp47 family protein [Oscillospiraceae bacterium]